MQKESAPQPPSLLNVARPGVSQHHAPELTLGVMFRVSLHHTLHWR